MTKLETIKWVLNGLKEIEVNNKIMYESRNDISLEYIDIELMTYDYYLSIDRTSDFMLKAFDNITKREALKMLLNEESRKALKETLTLNYNFLTNNPK